MKYQLGKLQQKTVEYAMKHPYSIIALKMGMGKSLCALDIWLKSGRKPMLIVCPGYLILNWKIEIKKFMPDDVVASYFTEGAFLHFPFDSDIVVISYDMVKKAEYLFEWAKIVIADEANYLMNMKAQRTEFFHRCIFENSIGRLHLLTGTPIKNKVEEYYSLISLCNYNPRILHSKFLNTFPDSITFADYFSFRKEYDVWTPRGPRRVMKWEGSCREDELKALLNDIYVRYENENEKPLIFKDIHVSDIDQPELLEAFEAFAIRKEPVKPQFKLEAALKTAPLTAKYCKDLMDEVGQLVIYSDHVEPIRRIAEAFGVRPITASTSPKARAKIAADFQAGLQKVIAATIGAFSTGVTLTAASHLVLNDPCWTPGDLEQVYYRINRIGQTRQCVIHRILGSPQAAYIYQVLEKKKQTIAKVI